jgi:transglutaminase-like putative cysteine protease
MGNARIIRDSDTLVAPSPVTGTEYEVRSRIEAAPSAAEVAATATRSEPIPDPVRAALELPEDFPRTLVTSARDITADATTPYAKAAALEHFFTDGSFTYDVNVDLGDSTDAIHAFLRLRRGFCQQFAAAFAALARANGLPARVVVGFTPGAFDETTGEYTVRGRDAHAWAEVWFAGLGWRTFEPTPAGDLPGQADARLGTVPRRPTEGTVTTTTTTTASGPTTPTTPTGADAATPRRDTLVSTETSTEGSGFDLAAVRWVAIPGLAAVGLVALVATAAVRRRQQRRRRRTDPLPRVRITGAWAEALDACTGAGLPVSTALTPLEQVDALSRHGAPVDAIPPLRDLATLYAEATWSTRPPTEDESVTAWTAVGTIRRSLTEGVGPRERTRRLLRSSFGTDQAESSR